MVMEMTYCPQCGTKLEREEIGGRPRPVCLACRFVQFPRVNLGVGGVVVHDNRVLLVQRKHNPGKGRWTTPGGYVEADEGFDHAVVREVEEETGLQCRVANLLAIRHKIDNADVYVAFRLTVEGGELNFDQEESADCRFFADEELDTLPNLAALSLELVRLGLADARGFAFKELPGYDATWRYYGAGPADGRR